MNLLTKGRRTCSRGWRVRLRDDPKEVLVSLKYTLPWLSEVANRLSIPGFHRTPVNSQSPWSVICALTRPVSIRLSRKTIFPSSLSNGIFRVTPSTPIGTANILPCSHGQFTLPRVACEVSYGIAMAIEHSNWRGREPWNLLKGSQIVLVQCLPRGAAGKVVLINTYGGRGSSQTHQ